jgi:hypothetical protein
MNRTSGNKCEACKCSLKKIVLKSADGERECLQCCGCGKMELVKFKNIIKEES